MAVKIENIKAVQAYRIEQLQEGQFHEIKGREVSPASFSKAISAFANSEGGDLYVGIDEGGYPKVRTWRGFEDQEAAAGYLNLFEQLFPLGTDFQYEFLQAENRSGLVLHVQVNKTRAIVRAVEPY